MLRRLGFVGRLMAIVFLALIALWLVGMGSIYVSAIPERSRILLPLPKQAAAIVELIETANENQRKAILDATNSDTLTVSLVDQVAPSDRDKRRLPAVEWLISRYIDALGDREIVALFGDASGFEQNDAWLRSKMPLLGRPLKFAVSLNTGGFVVFETRGEVGRRLLGLPLGFWVGILGALIGIAAIVAVAREARPLSELAKAVSRFGDEATPVAIKPSGAPEIANLIASVNDMQARISALVRGRTMFFGAVSHDLKTYITRLRLRAETIPNEEQYTRVTRDLDDMTTLIDDALSVARSSIVAGRREIVDLIPLIESEIESRHESAIRLRVEPEMLPLTIDGDALAIRRMFANLVDNALRFGLACYVTMAKEGDRAVIFVDDDGPGIPEQERLTVLEPFYRLETSRNRSTGGTGLGLAIVKEIVSAHGGTIEIETAPLGGARVRVDLPLRAVS